MSESALRERMAVLARSLFERGFSVGTAGNISAAVEDGLLMTPTNSSLGEIDPARISKLDRGGRHVAGDPPSKEVFLHQAFYETRQATRAVVHLHSTYATALSCLENLDANDCVPPLTPYVVMRVGRVKLIPYTPPGDPETGQLIRALEGEYAAVLLANHGPVVAAGSLDAAVFASEELEETAKLVLMLQGMKTRRLDSGQVDELLRRFGGRLR